jgi:hypothetical protein
VDTHVLMTERRPEVRTGATYAVRSRLAGTTGARMNPGRMQTDWVRCYSPCSTRRAVEIEAPPATVGSTYAGGC